MFCLHSAMAYADQHAGRLYQPAPVLPDQSASLFVCVSPLMVQAVQDMCMHKMADKLYQQLQQARTAVCLGVLVPLPACPPACLPAWMGAEKYINL